MSAEMTAQLQLTSKKPHSSQPLRFGYTSQSQHLCDVPARARRKVGGWVGRRRRWLGESGTRGRGAKSLPRRARWQGGLARRLYVLRVLRATISSPPPPAPPAKRASRRGRCHVNRPRRHLFSPQARRTATHLRRCPKHTRSRAPPPRHSRCYSRPTRRHRFCSCSTSTTRPRRAVARPPPPRGRPGARRAPRRAWAVGGGSLPLDSARDACWRPGHARIARARAPRRGARGTRHQKPMRCAPEARSLRAGRTKWKKGVRSIFLDFIGFPIS